MPGDSYRIFIEGLKSPVTKAPPQFEKFFEEIGIPIDDKLLFQPPPITPALIENVVETAAKYGVEIIT